MDYCYGLMTGLPKKAMKQLQKTKDQDSRNKRTENWLPVSYRIDFLIAAVGL